MLRKCCSYNGQATIKLCDNKFTFYTKIRNKQLAILYDISSSDYEESKLSMKVIKERSSVTISLEKSDDLFNIAKIFDLIVKTQSFSMDMTGVDLVDFAKNVHIMDEYKLICYDGIVNVWFTEEGKNVSFSIITNIETTFYGIHEWLSEIWPSINIYEEYCYSVNDRVIDNFQTIGDLDLSNEVCVSFSEKCYVSPTTEDTSPVAVPCSKSSDVIKRYLSNVLSVSTTELVLLDKHGKTIDDHTEIDFDTNRNKEKNNIPNLFYDLKCNKVTCISMRDETCVTQLMIGGNDRSIAGIKSRLEFKLKIDKSSIGICRNNLLMSNCDPVEEGDVLHYCSGQSFDNVTLESTAGRGSFGIVYRSIDKISGQQFALKEFSGLSNDETKCSIIREFMFAFRIEAHENVVRYLDIYIMDSRIAIGMEFMAGGSLHGYLTTNGPLCERDIKRFSLDIVHGLNHLHCHGTSHRDIKGDNVLLTASLRAKLCDFGLSKILTDYSKSSLFKDRTQTGECGTYRWMAPEVIKNKRYSLKADIWSFGATVIQMITGHVPYYTYEDEYAALFQIGSKETIEYVSATPLSSELQQFVDACLRSVSADRPTCDQLLLLPFLCS